MVTRRVAVSISGRVGDRPAIASATAARCSRLRACTSITLPPTRRLSSAGVPCGDRASVIDDHDLAREVVGLVEVLGGEQHVGAVLDECADRVPELAAAAGIEPGRGLVEQQQARRSDQARAQVEPAPHAARIRAREPVGGLAEPDLVEHVRRRSPVPCAGPGRTGGRPSRGSLARSSRARSPRTGRPARSVAAPPRARGGRRVRPPAASRCRGAAVSPLLARTWSCRPRSDRARPSPGRARRSGRARRARSSCGSACAARRLRSSQSSGVLLVVVWVECAEDLHQPLLAPGQPPRGHVGDHVAQPSQLGVLDRAPVLLLEQEQPRHLGVLGELRLRLGELAREPLGSQLELGAGILGRRGRTGSRRRR